MRSLQRGSQIRPTYSPSANSTINDIRGLSSGFLIRRRAPHSEMFRVCTISVESRAWFCRACRFAFLRFISVCSVILLLR